MTEDNRPNQDKRLSELKRIAIDIVSGIQSVIMSRDIINKRLEEGRALGFSDMEIGDAIRRESKGRIPDRTVRYYLPETAKHQEKSRAQSAATLPQNQEPELEFVVDKVDEYIANVPKEPEPPKPIDEPIAIPTGDRKIKLDTGKFRSDLRIALINGDKVWLIYDSRNEVTKIVE